MLPCVPESLRSLSVGRSRRLRHKFLRPPCTNSAAGFWIERFFYYSSCLAAASGIHSAMAQLTVLHNFTGGADGSSPDGSLTLSGTTLYGLTNRGGSVNGGVAFSIPKTGGTGRKTLKTIKMTTIEPKQGAAAHDPTNTTSTSLIPEDLLELPDISKLENKPKRRAFPFVQHKKTLYLARRGKPNPTNKKDGYPPETQFPSAPGMYTKQ